MNIIDCIILVIVVALLGLIIYFSFIRKKDSCGKCAYRDSCPEKREHAKGSGCHEGKDNDKSHRDND